MTVPNTTVYFSLGSNLGNRQAYLEAAINGLSQMGEVLALSPIYETEPWGDGTNGQPAYLNQVVALNTAIPALELLDKVLSLEQSLGRQRQTDFQYAPRTIDIDMLFYGSSILDTPSLILPHPRLHLREFVLQPLNDIAPQFVHPLYQKDMASFLADLQNEAS